MTSFYVTTPIYYVNDLPHIGHIFTTTAADTLARYRRLKGDDVYFLTGTDEHGQNIERAARKEGVAPIELADRVVSRYFELRERLGFSNDDFIRTTQERHHKGVREIIRRLQDAGDLYAATHEGWYCSPCETFYTEKELGPEKTCPVHGTAVEWKSEENVFFRLSKYQQPLLDWYDSDLKPVRPATRSNEVRSFVETGLRDLSVSRASLEWGIPFPGHPGQTVYVWLDALTNYISALGFGSDAGDLYRKFWEEGDVRLNLIGKDILRHHAVYWPAFLMSAGLPLPTTVFAHGWWYRDGRKMSKSIGNIVRPDEIIDRFGADPLRYFLLREMVFGQDASFSDEAFIDRYNADLANTLGNTVSRVVTLSRGAFDGKTPPVPCDDNPILEAARRLVPEYRAAMDELAFSRALEALWKLLNEASQYLVTREPWKLVKEEGPTEKLSRVLWNGLEAVRIVATGLLPFMPRLAPQILAAIGVTEVPASLQAMEWGGTPNNVDLPEPRPIFPRIDKTEYLGAAKAPEPGARPVKPTKGAAEKGKEKPLISIDKFFETELKVGTIQAAERVPKSDKLVKLSVDLGEETPRQLVAGIGLAYQPEELVGRQIAVVANLQPAKLMGVESQGMLLAASIDGKPVLLQPDKPVAPGTQVKCLTRDLSGPDLSGPIDSHCHLQNLPADERERAVDDARERGVKGFLVPATKLSEAEDILAFCHRHPEVWCALGVHPHDASTWQPGDRERLRSLLADPKAVAVGECGLDFYYDHSPRDVQHRVLREQWELAIELGLPVVVHNRDSNDEMLAVVREDAFRDLQADFHSFAGGRAMAEELIARGFYLGLSGMITFPGAANVREVIPILPPDRCLVETDTPYLAPVPYRGKPNRPAYVKEIAERLAQETGETYEQVCRRTGEGFFRLFGRAA